MTDALRTRPPVSFGDKGLEAFENALNEIIEEHKHNVANRERDLIESIEELKQSNEQISQYLNECQEKVLNQHPSLFDFYRSKRLNKVSMTRR